MQIGLASTALSKLFRHEVSSSTSTTRPWVVVDSLRLVINNKNILRIQISVIINMAPRFPTRRELARTTMERDPDLYAKAPFLRAEHLDNWFVLEQYIDSSEVIPGGLTRAAIKSFEWKRRTALGRHDFVERRRVWEMGRWIRMGIPRGIEEAYVKAVAAKLKMLTGPALPVEWGADLWKARVPQEEEYVRGMFSLKELVGVWQTMGVTSDVHRDAIIWVTQLLPSNYKSLKKSGITFWVDTVRYERRCRMETGVFVLWHQPEADSMNDDALLERFVTVPSWWDEWEVPQGFWA